MQSMNHLSTQAMIGVSHELLTTNRAELEAIPALRFSLGNVEEAHNRLVSLFKTTGQSKLEARQLTTSLGQADARHDRKARGIHGALTAWSELTDDEEHARQILRLRDEIFPIGLTVTQRSYREQAGAALQARQLLDQTTRETLASCYFAPKTLLMEIIDWLDTAQNIGEMQAERARLLGDTDADAVSQANLRDARFDWIRAMNYLLGGFDFVNMDADTRRRLLADLRDAQQRARKSDGASRAEAAPELESTEEPEQTSL